jgi:hypothetical protein
MPIKVQDTYRTPYRLAQERKSPLNMWWFEWKCPPPPSLQRVALLEGVALLHWGWVLRFQKPSLGPVLLSLLAACQSGCRILSYLSSTISDCVLPCFPPWQWIEPLNCKPVPVKCFPL